MLHHLLREVSLRGAMARNPPGRLTGLGLLARVAQGRMRSIRFPSRSIRSYDAKMRAYSPSAGPYDLEVTLPPMRTDFV